MFVYYTLVNRALSPVIPGYLFSLFFWLLLHFFHQILTHLGDHGCLLFFAQLRIDLPVELLNLLVLVINQPSDSIDLAASSMTALFTQLELYLTYHIVKLIRV